MKIAQVSAALWLLVALASMAKADTLVLNNGDRLTGTIESSDGRVITFKTDYIGEVKVKWSDVKQATTDKPLFVLAKNQNPLNGTVTEENSNMVVHTAAAGEVTVPLADVTVIRSPQEQAAYEKSLHPGPLSNWSGGANLGFALARGNSNTTNLALGLNADRKTRSDEIKAYVSSIYSTTGVIAGGTVTASEILGGIRYDRNLTEKMFAFVSGDFTHDALQSLDLQQIYSGGLGWHAIKQPATTLDLLAGANYTHESYSGATATSTSATVNQSFPALTLGEDFSKKIGSTSSFTQDFTFYPDLSNTSQYRFAADAGWTTQIKKWLGWQISFGDRYISNPPIVGTKNNDTLLSIGLKFSFASE
jgi:putative salt-induced outer membrane protein YdiY